MDFHDIIGSFCVVGTEVGSREMVGIRVGNGVGNIVGLLLGDTVGVTVGSMLGSTVEGLWVGAPDGISVVGDSDGSSVGR